VPSNFYHQVYGECESYFKKNTAAFLDNQIKLHLFKDKESVSLADKFELAKWIWLSSALVLGKEESKLLADKIISL